MAASNPSPTDVLRPLWADTCKKLGISAEQEEHWWQELERRHSEPQRRYHDFSHLAELAGYLEQCPSVQDREAIALAIFFHDAVYNPRAGSPQNEKDSAELFDSFAQVALPVGNPPGLAKGELISKVRRWIVQTADHKCKEDDESDCKFFMDFDMAVLGRPWDQYEIYSKQIREEYKHVPEAIYCRARAGFLASSCSAELFATEAFKDSHGERSKDNAAKEAAILEKRYSQLGIGGRLIAAMYFAPKLKSGRSRGAAVVLTTAALAAMAPKVLLAAAGLGFSAAASFSLQLVCSAPYIRFPYPRPSSRDELTVCFAGSWNPAHMGHLEILRLLSQKHKTVYAIIGVNPNKKYPVGPYVRQALLQDMCKELGLDNVHVVVYGGIIFQFAHSKGVRLMYRGIRSWRQDGKDEKYLEYQNLLYQYIFGYWPLKTVYVQSDPALEHLSSTLLRHRLKEGEDISDIVPAGCADAVRQAYTGNL